MACTCCGASRRLHCPDCYDKTVWATREDLARHSQRRAEVLELLEHEMDCGKMAQSQQRAQLVGAEARLAGARRHVADLQQALAATRALISSQAAALRQRQQDLAAEQASVAATRTATQREAATHMEWQSYTYLRNLDALAREQRHRVVRRAMEIFPLALVPPLQSPAEGSASSSNSSGGGASAAVPLRDERVQAMICSLLLPDSRDSPAELAGLAPALGSALGYSALLLDVLSRFMLLPLMHRFGFRGATSCVWQPDSWWDMRPGPPPDGKALPLFWPQPKQEGALAAAVAAGLSAAGAGPSSSGEGAERAATQQRRDLMRALYVLQRSVGSVVYAALGPDAPLRVPPTWSPFAWLAGLCKMLAAEPRGAGPHGRAAVPGGGRALAASAVFGRAAPGPAGMGGGGGAASQQSVLLGYATDEEEGAAEEWEILPTPSYGLLAPPPSEEWDVEQWARAMSDQTGCGSGVGATQRWRGLFRD